MRFVSACHDCVLPGLALGISTYATIITDIDIFVGTNIEILTEYQTRGIRRPHEQDTQFLAENQLTQVEAARRLGYSPEYLNRIMQGGDDITPAFCWRWFETFSPDTLRYLNGKRGAAS